MVVAMRPAPMNPTFMTVSPRSTDAPSARGRCNPAAELFPCRLARHSGARRSGEYDVQICNSDEPQHLTGVAAGVIIAFDRRARAEITAARKNDGGFLARQLPDIVDDSDADPDDMVDVGL